MNILKHNSKNNGVSQSRLSLRKRSIIIFAVCVSLLVGVFCTIVMGTVKRKLLTFCASSAEYAILVNNSFFEKWLSDYTADLRNFSEYKQLKEGNTDEIENFLSGKNETKKPYILDLFYSGLDGIASNSRGITLDIKNMPFFEEMISGRFDTRISQPRGATLYNRPYFVISKAVHGKNKSVTGTVFYAVDLNAITAPVSRISFAKNDSSFLIGTDGSFIIKPHNSVLSQKTENLDDRGKESLYNFSELVKSGKTGNLKLYSENFGNEFVSFARIKNTEWVFGLVEQQADIYNYIFDLRLRVIAILSLFGIALIVIFTIITLSGTRRINSHRLTLQQYNDFDELTGLWTEAKFEEEAQKLLNETPKKNYMLFGIDIRGFRIIQQTEGIGVANEQLVLLSKRLGAIAMQKGGIAGRGAIDHLFLMYPITNREDALRDFESLLFNGNYLSGRSGERISTKTGIVFAGKDFEQDTIQNLIGKTSYAKHMIQDNIIQNYSIYDQNMENHIIKEKRIERYIPIAFAHNEFYVVYQPKIDIKNGKIIGAEALVRWNSPELGPCMPDEFISLFERNGYINRLDFYVYKKVFEFLHNRIAEGKPTVSISVNMSRFHLLDDKFVSKFVTLFNTYNIPPSLVEVEIVERSVGDGDNRLVAVTQALHENNFRIAIDDFGHGESSLNIISEIPADVLKLDQKFMRSDKKDKPTDKDDYKIVTKIVEMAKALGKETICEGVETEQQIAFLRSVDVNYVQGFFYSKPLKERDFIEYMEKHA